MELNCFAGPWAGPFKKLVGDLAVDCLVRECVGGPLVAPVVFLYLFAGALSVGDRARAGA